MSDVKRVTDEWVRAFNAHDEEKIGSLMADDAVMRVPGPVELEGRDAIVGYTVGWLNAFPDARITVERSVVSGDWIAQGYAFSGTHSETLSGPAGEIPATGRRLEGQVADFARIEDGRMVEIYLYFDQVQLLTQLGLMPELARA